MLGASLALALPVLAAELPLAERVRRIVDAPEELPGLRLRSFELSEARAVIGLEVPASVPLDDLPHEVENRYELAVGAITASTRVRAIDLLVAHPGEPLLPPPRRAARPRPPKRSPSIAPDPVRFPHGQALRGKTIALSPGHGWIYYDNLGRFSTQRGRISWTGCGDCRGIVEDFETHEIVVGHLVPLLEGAGARVILVRERDLSSAGTITDDGSAGYSEVSGAFGDGTPAAAQPGHGGGYRVSSAADASAEWRITAPAAGSLLLSTWFPSDAARSSGALLEVLGPSGTHRFLFDQSRHGRRWAPIGTFDVEPNTELTVRLSAPPSGGGEVAFDAIRLGSGTHSSGHPWWEMGAAPFAEHQQAPGNVLALGDVTTRPVYAEFYGADVYLSVHSNASGQPDSTAAGTSTYRYNCGRFPDHSRDPAATDCDDPTGSDRLQALVHASFIDAVRGRWDQNWRDRGTLVANFGELRELSGIPGILIETGFHDNVRLADGSNLRMTDNQALHDPRWRRAAAFGLYRGLSEFLAGQGPLLLDPPAALSAKRVDSTRVELSFDAVAGAGSYRVYVARGSRTFDQGQIVQGSPAIIDGLTPEQPAAFKIATLNEAGEGLPSKVIVARPSIRPAQVLLIDAFDREDAWVQALDNKGDTLLVHGLALGGREHAFDSATESAWIAGSVDPAAYDALVVALGRESTADAVLTEALRAQVAAFAAAGGAVFASGSEIAWTLDARGTDESRSFLGTVFGAAYSADDAASPALEPAAGGLYAALSGPLSLETGTGVALAARSSDVLSLAGGAAVLHYEGGQAIAGVQRDRSVVLGVALDSLADPAARGSILGTWLDQIPVVPVEPAPDGGVVVPPDAGVEDAAQPPLDAGVADTGADDPDAGLAEDAAVAPDAAPGADAASPHLIAASETPIGGGCGCSTTAGGATSSAWGLVLLPLALISWRRRGSCSARSRSPDR